MAEKKRSPNLVEKTGLKITKAELCAMLSQKGLELDPKEIGRAPRYTDRTVFVADVGENIIIVVVMDNGDIRIQKI